MKYYLLTAYIPDDLVIEPAVVEALLPKLEALIQEMKAAGAWAFTGGLEEARVSTVVRLDGDEVPATDGPFGEEKWHAGGLMIIKAPDMDAAVEWGRKLARLAQVTKFPVEVRPFRFDAQG